MRAGSARTRRPIDLSTLIQATDFDGDTVGLSGDFKIIVIDDVPVLTSATASGAVDEGGLRFGLPILTAGDFFGNGNDHGATSATGSLANLVSFGADGPQSGTFSATTGSFFHHTTVSETIADGFQIVGQSAASVWLKSLGLSSHDQAINFATVTSTTSTDGTHVTDVETLTAWTNGGLFAGGHEVFTLALNVSTGAWTFTLINPIDDTAGNGTSATIDLSGLVQAIDYDGDVLPFSSGTPSASSDFTVTVADDKPVLTSASVSGSVDEGGLRDAAHGGTDSYGNGNDHGFTIAAGGGLLSGSLNNDVSFGADGPAQALAGGVPVIANGFQFAVASGSPVDFGVKSHGVEVNYISRSTSSASASQTARSQTLTA